MHIIQETLSKVKQEIDLIKEQNQAEFQQLGDQLEAQKEDFRTMNILYDEEKGQISAVIHDQRSTIDRLEGDISLHEKEASELKNKAKYSSCIESATMKMLRERSMILQGLVDNKSMPSYKKNGKEGMLIAERISSIVQGDSLAKSQSSHTLRLANVKNKLKQSMKREG